jgi:uncharacterized membrane protein
MRRDLDLVLVTGAALACAAGSLVGAMPTALSVAFALPLVLVLPGYALVEALGGASLDPLRRLVLAVSLSIATDVVLAIVLDRFPFGLTARSWALALAATTCAATFVALRRRRPGDRRTPGIVGLRLRPVDVAALVAAAGIVTVAIAVARTPLSATRAQGYTMLWLKRAHGGATVWVGVQSGELQTTTYRLVVHAGGRIVYRQPALRLAPGRRVVEAIRLPRASAGSRRPVAARLYRAGDRRVYRRARLLSHASARR